jgi:hypothetical protein
MSSLRRTSVRENVGREKRGIGLELISKSELATGFFGKIPCFLAVSLLICCAKNYVEYHRQVCRRNGFLRRLKGSFEQQEGK